MKYTFREYATIVDSIDRRATCIETLSGGIILASCEVLRWVYCDSTLLFLTVYRQISVIWNGSHCATSSRIFDFCSDLTGWCGLYYLKWNRLMRNLKWLKWVFKARRSQPFWSDFCITLGHYSKLCEQVSFRCKCPAGYFYLSAWETDLVLSSIPR